MGYLLALFFSIASPSLAVQTSSAPALASLETELTRVVDLFYDLQFDAAMKAAEVITARYPGHPAGPFYRSIVYYQKFLVEEPKSKETLKLFEREGQRAIDAGDGMMAANPAQAHYYLGATHGFRARVLAAQKHYVKAVPEAMRSVRHVKDALKIDPTLTDAYLGLGMYHYFTARMPKGAKPFAYLLGGSWGDREKGLEELHKVADHGGPARMEARSVLSVIYAMEAERNFDKSEAFLKELMERYPHNPLYRLRRTYVAERRQAWSEAVAFADCEGPWIAALPSSLQSIARNEARYRTAETYLLSGQPDKAEPLLNRLKDAKTSPSLAEWVLIRRGNLFDFRGQKDEAEAAYKQVKGKVATRFAEQFLRERYPAGPKTAKPWTGVETPQ